MDNIVLSPDMIFRLSIQMTASLDLATLKTNLKSILDSVLGSTEVAMYAVEYRAKHRRCRTFDKAIIKESVLHDLNQPAISLQLHANHEVVTALKLNQRVTSKIKQDSCRILYPVKGEFTEQLLIVIVTRDVDDKDLKIIDNIISLYTNQLNILSLSERDALTGLKNRQSFNHNMNMLIKHCQDEHSLVTDLCFAIIDIDHFKKINDNYGHLFGDEVLLMLANLMQSEFRFEDHLFRYGGEEFAVILTNVNLDQAKLVLMRFSKVLSKTYFPQIEPITISIGLVKLSAQTSAMDLIQQADQALYWAKENGRNRLAVFEELVEKDLIQISSRIEHQIELYENDDDDEVNTALP